MECLIFFFLEKAKIIEKEKMYPMALLLWNRAAIQGIEPDKNEHLPVPCPPLFILFAPAEFLGIRQKGAQVGGISDCTDVRISLWLQVISNIFFSLLSSKSQFSKPYEFFCGSVSMAPKQLFDT